MPLEPNPTRSSIRRAAKNGAYGSPTGGKNMNAWKSRPLAIAVAAALAVVAGPGDAKRLDTETDAMVKARNLFFGAQNVDQASGQVAKDKVIFSWLTNTTYAVSAKGRVFLLDSFVTRLETLPGRTPFVLQDMVNLQPEAILLGHGHGDHADNAAYIAHQPGSTIYSSPETCDVMQLDAARMFGAGVTVPCKGIVSRGSQPGAEIVKLDFLEPIACITAFKHIHSGTVPRDSSFPLVPVSNIADPRDATMFPKGASQNSVFNTSTTSFGSPPGNPAGSISLYYQFVMRGDNRFTFAWHNTGGPLKEGAGADPGLPSPAIGQRVLDIIDALPKTDVELGSIVTLGTSTNGLRDPLMYVQHVKPKIYIPGHMTAVALESSSLEWKVSLLKLMNQLEIPADQRPELRWLVDPNDYATPLVYDPKDARWADTSERTAPIGLCQ
jgi:hypothetical protein